MKEFVLIAGIVLMQISPAFAAPKVLATFSANAGEMRIHPKEGHERLKKKTVTVKVPAVMFKKPLVIPDVRTAKRTAYQEVNFLIEYTKANISGTPEEIASFWTPEERTEKLALFKDSETLSQNRSYFLKNPGLHILGIIYQKNTLSVLQPFSDVMAVGITMQKIGNRYFLTDHPTDDLELAVVEAALKDKH